MLLSPAFQKDFEAALASYSDDTSDHFYKQAGKIRYTFQECLTLLKAAKDRISWTGETRAFHRALHDLLEHLKSHRFKQPKELLELIRKLDNSMQGLPGCIVLYSPPKKIKMQSIKSVSSSNI